jgi:hypothetical protein
MGEMVEISDPHRRLHEYIDENDEEWSGLLLFGWEIEPHLGLSLFVLFYFDLGYLC